MNFEQPRGAVQERRSRILSLTKRFHPDILNNNDHETQANAITAVLVSLLRGETEHYQSNIAGKPLPLICRNSRNELIQDQGYIAPSDAETFLVEIEAFVTSAEMPVSPPTTTSPENITGGLTAQDYSETCAEATDPRDMIEMLRLAQGAYQSGAIETPEAFEDILSLLQARTSELMSDLVRSSVENEEKIDALREVLEAGLLSPKDYTEFQRTLNQQG